MTMTTSHNWIAYTAGAAQTVFPYDFLIPASTDLRVYKDRVLQTTGYTVSGAGVGSGGNVTFAAGLVGGEIVLLLRATDETQQVDLIEGDKLPAEVVEDIFDKVYAALQDVTETTTRAFGLPVSRAGSAPVMPDFNDAGIWGKALIVKSDGSGLDVVTLVASPISSPITSLGDLIQGGTAGVPERLAVGATDTLLTVIAGKAAWRSLADRALVILTANGDLLYRNGAGTVVRLPIGSSGQLLQVTGGVPVWTTVSFSGAGAPGAAFFEFDGIATPGTPASGKLRLYVPTAGTLKQLLGVNSAGSILRYRARLDRQTGSVATGANTTETILFTATLPADLLGVNGQAVHVKTLCVTGANGNNKTMRIRFGGIGGTVVSSTGAAAGYNNETFLLDARIIRTGAATQDAWGGSTGQLAGGGRVINTFSQPTQTLSGAIDVVVTGQNGTATASDIVCKGLEVLVD